jgi:tripartite-type tricarboxylate transporter receptor subunit TctC
VIAGARAPLYFVSRPAVRAVRTAPSTHQAQPAAALPLTSKGKKDIMPLRFACTLLSATIGAAALAPADTTAQSYPHKPIRILVGFTPGGNADVSARILTARMAQALGTAIVVENRSGAAGSVAAQIVSRATPDGYTLLWANTGSFAVNPILQKNLPYDPEKAFAPVGLTLTFCNVLIAHPDAPFASVPQLLAQAKAKPKQINLGSQGIGSAGFLSGQLLEQTAGIQLSQVPYKGGAEAVTAVVGGELQLAFAATNTAGGMRNRLKLLAVTSTKRDPVVPEVPTLHEAGLKGYDATFWFGVATPAGTPAAVVQRLNGVLRDALTDPEMIKTMQRHGLNAEPSTPEEFRARARSDHAKWKRVLEGS